jgi:hypothetical protein
MHFLSLYLPKMNDISTSSINNLPMIYYLSLPNNWDSFSQKFTRKQNQEFQGFRIFITIKNFSTVLKFYPSSGFGDEGDELSDFVTGNFCSKRVLLNVILLILANINSVLRTDMWDLNVCAQRLFRYQDFRKVTDNTVTESRPALKPVSRKS